MDFKSKHVTADNGAAVEVATVVYNGHEFTNLGSVIDHERGYVVGYVKGATLIKWNGEVIGSVREVSKWRTPRSFVSSHMHSYRAVIDGRRYHGRGCGDGMILKLKACK